MNKRGRTWLPFIVKTLATVYLVEAPLLVVLRAIVLMFVPSKIDWGEPFNGIPMRVWAVVLAVAALTYLASGILGWVIGVWLARRQPGAIQAWQLFSTWLVVQHGAWLVWAYLTRPVGSAFWLLPFSVLQGVVVLALTIYSWFLKKETG
ncbi:MAG: hypothetical protein U0175_34130 [Caldilineaceae bacterium]